MSESAHDYWFQELCRVRKRHPHPPYACESIASSSPIALFYCRCCNQTYLALRHIGYVCEGGLYDPFQDPPPVYFGTRNLTLSNLDRIAFYSDETGTEEAVAYHHAFKSQFTKYR